MAQGGGTGSDEGRSCRYLKAMNTAKVRLASPWRNLTVGFNDGEREVGERKRKKSKEEQLQ